MRSDVTRDVQRTWRISARDCSLRKQRGGCDAVTARCQNVTHSHRCGGGSTSLFRELASLFFVCPSPSPWFDFPAQTRHGQAQPRQPGFAAPRPSSHRGRDYNFHKLRGSWIALAPARRGGAERHRADPSSASRASRALGRPNCCARPPPSALAPPSARRPPPSAFRPPAAGCGTSRSSGRNLTREARGEVREEPRRHGQYLATRDGQRKMEKTNVFRFTFNKERKEKET